MQNRETILLNTFHKILVVDLSLRSAKYGCLLGPAVLLGVKNFLKEAVCWFSCSSASSHSTMTPLFFKICSDVDHENLTSCGYPKTGSIF